MAVAARRALHPLDRLQITRGLESEAPRAALGQDFVESERRRGRGTLTNRSGRYEPLSRESFDDGWRIENDDEIDPKESFRTEVTIERARSIISRNDSPDLSFDRSINPYRGCEHGCVYCFARPTHAYMGLSPGLDFETKLFAKPNAAELLEKELSHPSYSPRVIAIGTNTDPYQPIERKYRIMRGVLEVMSRFNHPVGIVTKSALVARDIDILAPMAEKGLAKVALSVTTLDAALAREMEPRAATPSRRLATIKTLASAGIPVSVLVAPVIPSLNDGEIEKVLAAAREAGAQDAGYVLLRLPLELRHLVREWLLEHHPGKLDRVMSLVKSTRDGKDYDARFGVRQTGEGPYAWTIGRRFEIAARKLGFNRERTRVRTDLFRVPGRETEPVQLALL
ncbi:MAG: PA0069 family radical SAM protein [Hyphomicrobiales bacterium]|nr:PA0069 family radical SAM protein [Hyphomicrobiales bacterium]MBV9114975.1 PA0069 family radical SAM protein [Hyphomicrobiales bacterium]